jgi:tetratricopeptide (TPR) repeat protein
MWSRLNEALRLMRASRVLGAEEILDELQRQPEGHSYAALGRAHLLLHQGRYQESIDAATRAANGGLSNHGKAQAFVLRANARLGKGEDADDAAIDFKRALALEPSNKDAKAGLNSLQHIEPPAD